MRCLILLLIFLCPSLVWAADAQSASTIVDTFQNAIKDFEAGILSAAKILFFALLAIELPVAAVKKTIGGDSWEDWMFFVPKVMLAPLFFGAMMVASNKYLNGIVQSFRSIGESASGSSFSASNLVSQGWSLAKMIVSNVGITDILDNFLVSMAVLIAALLMLIAFAIASAQVIMAYIESTIVITLAPLYFSFGALSFTREWATKVFSHAVATGTKILIIMMLGVAMNKMGASWITQMKSANLLDDSGLAFEIMGSAIIMIYLSLQVPSIAAAIMSGNTTMGAGSLVTGTLGAIAAAAAAGAVATEKLGDALGGLNKDAGGVGANSAADYMKNAGAEAGKEPSSPAASGMDGGGGSGGGGNGGSSNSNSPGAGVNGSAFGQYPQSDNQNEGQSAKTGTGTNESSKDDRGNNGNEASPLSPASGSAGAEAGPVLSKENDTSVLPSDVAGAPQSTEPTFGGKPENQASAPGQKDSAQAAVVNSSPENSGNPNSMNPSAFGQYPSESMEPELPSGAYGSGASTQGPSHKETADTPIASDGGDASGASLSGADSSNSDENSKDKKPLSSVMSAFESIGKAAEFGKEHTIVDNAQAGASINVNGPNH